MSGSWQEWAQKLISVINPIMPAVSQLLSGARYDEDGRLILDLDGVYIYNNGRQVAGPNIVEIDTPDVVDNAISQTFFAEGLVNGNGEQTLCSTGAIDLKAGVVFIAATFTNAVIYPDYEGDPSPYPDVFIKEDGSVISQSGPIFRDCTILYTDTLADDATKTYDLTAIAHNYPTTLGVWVKGQIYVLNIRR
jgi:hypothetical protein